MKPAGVTFLAVLALSTVIWGGAGCLASVVMRDPPTAYRKTVGEVAVMTLPPAELTDVCAKASIDPAIPHGKTMACSMGQTVVMPDPQGVDPVLWVRLYIHELAHVLGGWPANHPDQYVVSP